MMSLLSSTLLLSLITVCIALSVVLSLRFLHFPDLTIDGTVATSGGAFAVVLVQTGSTLFALAAAVTTGFACGLLTMFLHERLGVGKLLAGILVFTALYSIDLRLMGGSNVSILGVETWFDQVDAWETRSFSVEAGRLDPVKLAVLAVVILGLCLALYRFFHARSGIVIRAVGDNERAVARLAINVGRYKYLGLGFANAVAGLGAALIVMNQGFADVGMGAGSLVLGLAAVIIGEKIVGQFWGSRDLVLGLLLAAFIGMIIYQALWLLVLRAGMSPTDLKLFTAVLVVASLVWGRKVASFYEGRVF